MWCHNGVGIVTQKVYNIKCYITFNEVKKMGEIAEMMLDGTLCESCGTFLNENPIGFPDYCEECQHEEEVKNG